MLPLAPHTSKEIHHERDERQSKACLQVAAYFRFFPFRVCIFSCVSSIELGILSPWRQKKMAFFFVRVPDRRFFAEHFLRHIIHFYYHSGIMSARPKVALITGITGQDGSYLAELLLDKGYVVHGIIRRSSSFNTGRVEHLYYNKNLKLHYGDMTDGTNLMSILAEARPAQAMRLKNYLFSSFFFETVATCNLQKRNLQIKIQSLWKFLASTLHVGFL